MIRGRDFHATSEQEQSYVERFGPTVHALEADAEIERLADRERALIGLLERVEAWGGLPELLEEDVRAALEATAAPTEKGNDG